MIVAKLYKLYLHALTGSMIAVPFLFAHYIEQQFILLFLNIVLIICFHIIVVRGYMWINDPDYDNHELQRRSLILAGPIMALVFAVVVSNPGAAGMMLGVGLIVGSNSRFMTLVLYALATLLITFCLMLTSLRYQAPPAMLVMLPMLLLLGLSDRGHLYKLIHPANDCHTNSGFLTCKRLD